MVHAIGAYNRPVIVSPIVGLVIRVDNISVIGRFVPPSFCGASLARASRAGALRASSYTPTAMVALDDVLGLSLNNLSLASASQLQLVSTANSSSSSNRVHCCVRQLVLPVEPSPMARTTTFVVGTAAQITLDDLNFGSFSASIGHPSPTAKATSAQTSPSQLRVTAMAPAANVRPSPESV